MDNPGALARLHYELIHTLIESGTCPTNSELMNRMNVSRERLEALLLALSNIHGLVLHPHECRPWIIHPFSLTPTIHCIEGGRGKWWAPCAWCALGVATLIGGEVRLHTRIGGESESLSIPVRHGHPVGFEQLLVHFAIPPARAWDNVHEHCSMVLPFHNADQIREWCSRHRLPLGEPVPLHQVARLAREWYGPHSDPAWHKWTVAEAQEIFTKAGLVSSFWDLGARTGRF